MTTKPKARKFRIRRTGGPSGERPVDMVDIDATEQQSIREAVSPAQSRDAPPSGAGGGGTGGTAPEDLLAPPDRPEDGFGDAVFPGSTAYDERAAQSRAAPQPGTQGTADELAAIRAEGLTGRQLRMARRTAQKHGLKASSDFDAVRQLRARKIDPFGKSNMLELVVNQGQREQATRQTLPVRAETAKLPATHVAPPPPTSPGPLDANERAAEIMKIQRDIARRRRKRLALLATRIAIFILLPTLLVGYYYFRVATPLYATNTELVIQKADSGSSSGGGGLGGLLGGSSFATVTESITVQSYLESREAMLRLDDELGFREHFSGADIDPLTRLAPDASDEAMYDVYRRHLTIGYDPTEGLIKMEMAAADPETSQDFSEALIRYAEERVDQMSQRLRIDQMTGANDVFEDAVTSVTEAQQRVLELQQRSGVLSAEAEVSQVFNQIGTFEMELQQERLRLDELMANPRPQQTRVDVTERNIDRLETLIADLRSSLTEAQGGEASLARVQSELIIAQADLETRQMMLANSLQAVESARTEANRQTLYLSIGVFPVAPDEPAYPRAFENTLLAFLILSGIYLMISMTASILREQVSS